MANYRVSTNTHNSNKTTQDKTKTTTTKQREMDQLRPFTLKHDLVKISVDLQTAFAADTHPAERATESGKVMYVLSRNTNDDCFKDRGVIFSAIKDNYIKKNASKRRCLICSVCKFHFYNIL
jgi:hypothetical protein